MRSERVFGWTVLLAALALPGCHRIARFDTSALDDSRLFECSARVRGPGGTSLTVHSDEEPYSDRRLVVGHSCPAEVEDAIPGDWMRWVTDQVEAGWCIEEDSVTCEYVTTLPDTTCPPELTLEPRICEPWADPCLEIEPEPVDFEAILIAGGLSGEVAVGAPAPFDVEVVVRNSCASEVGLFVDGRLGGRDQADFSILENGCDIPDPEHPELYPDGRRLEPAGFDGDSCSLDVRFTPTAHGERFAFQDVPQAPPPEGEQAQLRLRGRGISGRWNPTPDSVCVDDLLADGCTEALAVPLVNDGPGWVTITEIVASGRFEVTSALPTPLEPGTTHVALVRWCREAGGDVDDEGTLTVDSNGRPRTLLIPLARRSAGC